MKQEHLEVMKTAIVKIIEHQFDFNKNKWFITAKIIEGIPSEKNRLWIDNQFMIVEKVESITNFENVKIIVSFEEKVDKWADFLHMDLDRVFCGISIQNFHSIPNKKKYFEKIIEFEGEGNVIDFLKNNLKTEHRILTKEDELLKYSKIGGLPFAPKNFEFPKDSKGQSNLFIGQFEVDFFDEKGILYVFASIRIQDDEYYGFGDFTIKFSQEAEDLINISLPNDLKEYGVFEEKKISFFEQPSIPPSETSLLPNSDEDWSIEESESYYSIWELFTEDLLQYLGNPKFLGHPNQVQGDLQFEAEQKLTKRGWYDSNNQTDDYSKLAKELNSEAKKWRLLFQYDVCWKHLGNLSFFEGQFGKYMDGVFFVMIKEQDLLELNFEKTVTVYQCT